MESIYDVLRQVLLDNSTHFSGALLYLDAGAGEVISTGIGASALFGLGALNVCDLQHATSSDAVLPELQGRRVEILSIIVTQLLPAAHPLIVKAILAHPNVKVCNIFTSITEHAHACLGVTGVEGYAEYSTSLQQEVAELCVNQQGGGFARAPPEIRVKYLPINTCPIGGNSFVLPASSSTAQQSVANGKAAGWGAYQAREDDEDAAVATSDIGLSLTAHTLAGIVSMLGTSMNIFHVGPASQRIAQELATLPLPPSHHSSTQQSDTNIAVVLVDRCLDLVTPAVPTDHPVDCMLAHLPRPPAAPFPWNTKPGTCTSWRSVDIRADGAPYFPVSVPGCPVMGLEVFRPSDPRTTQWMDQMLMRKGKDAAFLLRKWLKEGLREEKIKAPFPSKMGAVPPSELQGFAEVLAKQSGARMRQLSAMSLGFAGAQALGGGPAAAWEACMNLGKQVLQAQHSGMDIGQLLLDVLNNILAGKGMVGVQEVVQLLAAAYSLAGDRYWIVFPIGPDDERQIRSKLVDLFLLPPGRQLEGTVLRDFQQHLQEAQQATSAGHDMSSELQGLRLEAEAIVDRLFENLHHLAKCRKPLKELHTLARGTPQDPQAFVPLLCQVVDNILQDEGGADLTHVTSQLRGLLSLGLGHLGLKHKQPKPSDSPAVLLFVVGGISLAEVREVYQELSVHLGHKPRFVLGGTSLITPIDVADKLCGI